MTLPLLRMTRTPSVLGPLSSSSSSSTIRPFRCAAQLDVLDEPAGGYAAEGVRLFAFFAYAAHSTVLGVDLVIGPGFACANLGFVGSVRRGRQDLHVVGRSAGQVQATGDQVLSFGALEA